VRADTDIAVDHLDPVRRDVNAHPFCELYLQVLARAAVLLQQPGAEELADAVLDVDDEAADLQLLGRRYGPCSRSVADQPPLPVAMEQAVVGDQGQPGLREEGTVVEPPDLEPHPLARAETAVAQQILEPLCLSGADAVDDGLVVFGADAVQFVQCRVEVRPEAVPQRTRDPHGAFAGFLLVGSEDDVRVGRQLSFQLGGWGQQVAALGLLVDRPGAVPEPFGADNQDRAVRLEEGEQASAGALLGACGPLGHGDLAALNAARGELAEGVEGADGVDLVAEELNAHRLRRAMRIDVQDAAAQAVLPRQLYLRRAAVAVVHQPLDDAGGGVLVADGDRLRSLAQIVGGAGRLEQGGGGGDDHARARPGFQVSLVGGPLAAPDRLAEGQVTQHAQARA